MNRKLLLKGSLTFSVCILVLTNSCQKDDFVPGNMLPGDPGFSGIQLTSGNTIVYFPNERFIITSKKQVDEIRDLGNENFEYYDNFTLVVQNGNHGGTRVTRLEILIDSKRVVSFTDFKKNSTMITKNLSGLTPNSVLEVRMDGNPGRFVKVQIECTLKAGVIADRQGNLYNTVKIGDQVWMAENLKTTVFNDGTEIPDVTSVTDWFDFSMDYKPGYCWYDNDEKNKATYGALYNWAAAGNDKLCPAGWHLPDSYDFYKLAANLDGDAIPGVFSSYAGGFLKEEGLAHWQSPNTDATNRSGFTARPAGYRFHDGSFTNMGRAGFWWSDGGISYSYVSHDNPGFSFGEGRNEYGHSVRCLMD